MRRALSFLLIPIAYCKSVGWMLRILATGRMLERMVESAHDELRKVYDELAVALEPFRRHCAARGICCNFARTGHMLYLTDLEASEMARAGMAAESQSNDGVCPYLRGNLCGAREHRALGCRIYFCDRTYEEDRNALYERFLHRIREIEGSHGIAHSYRAVTSVDFKDFQ